MKRTPTTFVASGGGGASTIKFVAADGSDQWLMWVGVQMRLETEVDVQRLALALVSPGRRNGWSNRSVQVCRCQMHLLCRHKTVERMPGIEPRPPTREVGALPLSYIREKAITVTYSSSHRCIEPPPKTQRHLPAPASVAAPCRLRTCQWTRRTSC